MLNETHRKIIEAVIKKAVTVCPGSVPLIAVYGSAATGDVHEKSDLDLLIIAEDEKARALSESFILEDGDTGYDLYCTTWDMLEDDASCGHANISKLLDSVIVYAADDKPVIRLNELREKAKAILASPERFEKAAYALKCAKAALCDCMLDDPLSKVRTNAAGTIYYLLDTIMLYHGTYFRKGTKRTFEELAALDLPFDIKDGIIKVISAVTAAGIRSELLKLMKAVCGVMRFPHDKEAPSAENLSGTYEEMYSNWHGKMHEAAERNDIYSSFMSLAALQMMMHETADCTDINDMEIMDGFDPSDLAENEKVFGRALDKYLKEYTAIGLKPRRYKNAEDFSAAYTAK